MSCRNPSESLQVACMPGISRFSSILDTNYAPSDDEMQEILDLLKGPAARLKALEIEVARAHKLYLELVEQKQSLSAEMERVRALFSPMRRLPTDILQEIFFQCLPKSHNAVMSTSNCPVLLTRVCRSWRNTALSSPRLWASLHIPVPSSQQFFYLAYPQVDVFQIRVKLVVQRRAAAIREWLGRSGTLPLSISFSGPSLEGPEADAHCEAIVNAFLPFSSRWQRLELFSYSFHLAKIAATADVPMLESVVIDEGRGVGLSPEHKKWGQSSLLNNAPNLRNVSVCNLAADPISSLPLKWSQLTSLSLNGLQHGIDPNLYDILHALGPCVQLVTLQLILPRYDIGADQDRDPEDISWSLFLPSLQDFTIQDGASDLTSFFQLFEAPSLRTFEYMALRQSDSEFSGPSFLPSFLSRTPSLSKLTLDPENFERELLIQTLRHCPGIKSLLFRDWIGPGGEWNIHDRHLPHIIDDDFLNLFILADENECYLCPELEDFECHQRAGFTDECMVDFIKRKQDGSVPAVAKLKQIQVHFDRLQTCSIREGVEQFIEEGLALHTWYDDASYIPDNSFSPFEGIQNPEEL